MAGVYHVSLSVGRELPPVILDIPANSEAEAFHSALHLLRVAQPYYTGPIYGAGYPFPTKETQHG